MRCGLKKELKKEPIFLNLRIACTCDLFRMQAPCSTDGD